VFEGASVTKDGDITDEYDFNEPHAKANLLLQCHFNRRPLSVDLRTDQKMILERAIKLVHAMVDVISTNGFLNATLLAMELSQMIVQAMWPKQSPLLQLPGFDSDLVETLKKKVKVEDITDFMNMEDEDREKFVPVSQKEMEKLADVCNRYPIVELKYEISADDDKSDEEAKDESTGLAFEPGQNVNIEVTVSRDEDEDEESLEVFNQPAFAQFYPEKKSEEWWVVIGHTASGKLLAIKKIPNFKAQRSVLTKLSFAVGAGDFIRQGESYADLKLYLVCDSYVGCDLQENLQIKLKI